MHVPCTCIFLILKHAYCNTLYRMSHTTCIIFWMRTTRFSWNCFISDIVFKRVKYNLLQLTVCPTDDATVHSVTSGSLTLSYTPCSIPCHIYPKVTDNMRPVMCWSYVTRNTEVQSTAKLHYIISHSVATTHFCLCQYSQFCCFIRTIRTRPSFAVTPSGC